MRAGTLASIRNKHFFTISCHHQTFKNYEEPPEISQKSNFQSHFSTSKINGIFRNFSSWVVIKLGDQLLEVTFSENFDFKSI